MTRITISVSDEELQRLQALSEREGLSVEQLIRLGVHDLLSQPDEAFRAAAQHNFEKNADLYGRLA